MPIKGIVALSDKFREWIKIGFYDFCHLYHTMKVPLDNEDIKELIRRQGINYQLIIISGYYTLYIEVYRRNADILLIACSE